MFVAPGIFQRIIPFHFRSKISHSRDCWFVCVLCPQDTVCSLQVQWKLKFAPRCCKKKFIDCLWPRIKISTEKYGRCLWSICKYLLAFNLTPNSKPFWSKSIRRSKMQPYLYLTLTLPMFMFVHRVDPSLNLTIIQLQIGVFHPQSSFNTRETTQMNLLKRHSNYVLRIFTKLVRVVGNQPVQKSTFSKAFHL